MVNSDSSRYSFEEDRETLMLLSVVNSGLSFTSVQRADVHWLEDAVHPFGLQHAARGTDRLGPML